MSEVHPRTVFAVVVDGEIAWLHGVDHRAQQAIAAFSSDPKIVEVPESVFNTMQLKPEFYAGWTYDGVSFIEPA